MNIMHRARALVQTVIAVATMTKVEALNRAELVGYGWSHVNASPTVPKREKAKRKALIVVEHMIAFSGTRWMVDDDGDIGILLLGRIPLGSYKEADTFVFLVDRGTRYRPIRKREANVKTEGWEF